MLALEQDRELVVVEAGDDVGERVDVSAADAAGAQEGGQFGRPCEEP